MIPGFAKVEDVASFLNELGTEIACALGFNGASKPRIEMRAINLSFSTLLNHFLAKSAL